MDPSQPRSEEPHQPFNDAGFISPYANRRGGQPVPDVTPPSQDSQDWTPPPYGQLEATGQSQPEVKARRPVTAYLEGPYRYATMIIPAFGGMVLLMILGVASPIGLGASYYAGLVATNKKLESRQKRNRYLIITAVVAITLVYSFLLGSKSVMG